MAPKTTLWPLDDHTLGQLSFESRVVDFNELDRALLDEFGMNQLTKIESIEEFMCSDRVLFHSIHLRSRLADMERASALIVEQSPRKRRGAFPPGTLSTLCPSLHHRHRDKGR